MGREDRISDHEFVTALRSAIERYFGAVDEWESAYQKYYRMPGLRTKIGEDLEAEHRQYCERRRDLQQLLPRARRLCLKHQLREPFSGLLRISLGQYAPQQRLDSAIGRNERNLVTKCLVELNDVCREWQAEPATPEPAEDEGRRDKGSFLRRLVDYFY